MISEQFSLGKIYEQSKELPSLKFRDKDPTTHDASSAATCHRQVTYKKLGYEVSNPVDMYGTIKMNIGSWIERGINYDLFGKGAIYGVIDFGGQGACGEHNTFYGTSWHGYRDRDIFIRTVGENKFAIVELKTKIGSGAAWAIKESAWSKKFIVPTPDTEWGQAQQISLYLRDAYLKTSKNPKFKTPIVDGILLQVLFDGAEIAGFVEFFAEYLPETDQVKFYRVTSEQYPQCNGEINLVIDLKDIADRFLYQDAFIRNKELAPPEFERKYSLDNPKVQDVYKSQLEQAIKGNVLLGDVHCKYCGYRDKCAKDCNVTLEYSAQEVKQLKNMLKDK